MLRWWNMQIFGHPGPDDDYNAEEMQEDDELAIIEAQHDGAALEDNPDDLILPPLIPSTRRSSEDEDELEYIETHPALTTLDADPRRRSSSAALPQEDKERAPDDDTEEFDHPVKKEYEGNGIQEEEDSSELSSADDDDE
ncbi:hypothetical protein A0H81_07434 [Grifola frondosa]|uniref:Uncharacterized protein n=1 Tax=Grifola frondosa TaxID=5627 RepID=A0A1C7M6J3_GRIFR|nr:hypothetical protein A0H81_07434 [Grifola frondosa]